MLIYIFHFYRQVDRIIYIKSKFGGFEARFSVPTCIKSSNIFSNLKLNNQPKANSVSKTRTLLLRENFQSNKKFCLNIKPVMSSSSCLSPSKSCVCVCANVTAVVTSVCLFLAFDCRLTLVNEYGWMVPSVCLFIFILNIAFWLKTACSDPGVIPRSISQSVVEQISLEQLTTTSDKVFNFIQV